MTEQIILHAPELHEALIDADITIREVYAIKTEADALRDQADKHKTLAENKRKNKRNYRIRLTLLLPIPLILPLSILFALLAEIPLIGIIFEKICVYFIDALFDFNVGAFIIITVIIAVIIFIVLSFIPSGEKKDILVAEDYDNKANEKMYELGIYIENNKHKVAIINPKYRYPQASSFLVELFQMGRATTLPEAYDKLEEQLFRWKVEDGLNNMILNQIGQTAILSKIEYNTRWII